MDDRLRQLLAGLLAISTLGIAGCVSEELSEPQVSLQVRQADRWGDACATSSTMEYRVDAGEACHEIHVLIENGNQQEDLDTDQFTWEGVSGNGSIHDADETRGPDAVAAGGSAEVVVMFAVDSDAQLTEVRYEDLFMRQPVRAAVPSY